MLSLKPLSPSAIPAALAKAERYRLLGEPAQAESICEDVLAADPDNTQALVTLILAITDAFSSHEGNRVRRAQELAARLPGEYERQYYAGLIAERRARALLHRGGPGGLGPAGDWLRGAMQAYERAERMRPPDNDDALLRWNACVRFCRQHPGLLHEEESRTAPVMLE
jgi:hypothetical protein